MNKKELRKLAVENRKKHTDLQKTSEIICDKIIALEAYKNADIVFAYMATDREVNLKKLMEQCFLAGKKVVVPKITDKNLGIMEFAYIDSFDDLKEGYMHILEPLNNEFADIDDTADSIMILPGLAFDKMGHRCGYGGGFYDRYISKGYKGVKVAVTIDENIFESIETDIYDEKYDILVSDKNIILYNHEEKR